MSSVHSCAEYERDAEAGPCIALDKGQAAAVANSARRSEVETAALELLLPVLRHALASTCGGCAMNRAASQVCYSVTASTHAGWPFSS